MKGSDSLMLAVMSSPLVKTESFVPGPNESSCERVRACDRGLARDESNRSRNASAGNSANMVFSFWENK